MPFICVCAGVRACTWYILSHMKVWPPSMSSVCPALRGLAHGLVTMPSFCSILFLHCMASSTINLHPRGHVCEREGERQRDGLHFN